MRSRCRSWFTRQKDVTGAIGDNVDVVFVPKAGYVGTTGINIRTLDNSTEWTCKKYSDLLSTQPLNSGCSVMFLL